MAKKVNVVIWSVLTAAMAIFTVLKPRVSNIMTVLFAVIVLIYFRNSAKETIYKDIFSEKTPPPVRLVVFMMITFFLWIFFGFFDIFCPYHAFYEYKGDMKKLKADYSGYSHFPDTLPEPHNDLKWERMPSVLQGSGYDVLFCYTDTEYVKKIEEEYSSQGKLCVYNETCGDFVYAGTTDISSEDLKDQVFQTVSFPGKRHIPDDEKEITKVIILYDNHDTNHPHIEGIYYNESGLIGFFNE